MSKKTKGKKGHRQATDAAPENALVSSRPLENIFQARALVAFLQGVEFIDEEAPGRRVMYGYGLILSLISTLLDQACRRIESQSSRQ